MCRPSSLIFIALCVFSVNSKPLETQDGPVTPSAPASAVLNDPDVMASFLEFLQQHLNGLETTSKVPPEIQPVTTPVVISEPQPTPPVITLPVQLLPVNPAETRVNSSIQQWGNVRIVTPTRINVVPIPDPLTSEQQRQQALNAKYQFSTYMDDNIKGSFLSRAEVRSGLKVKGQYEYDDGFVHRTVYYEADENGYRIVREETKPSIKTTPLDGTAKVQIHLDGTQVDYNIARKDVTSPTKVIV
nr:uncharacterized protein LOC111511051 [Leptinotarsa decemlineata]